MAGNWKNPKKRLKRSKKARIEILYSQLCEVCVAGCNRCWLEMAVAVLERNNIKQEDFGEAVCNVIEKGRGKCQNVYLKVPANCTKTFLLNPLTTVFNTFCNPASTTFAWVGAEEAEVLFLNDFRWSLHIIPYHDFLLLLEGQEVHLPAQRPITSKIFHLKAILPYFTLQKRSCHSYEQDCWMKGKWR